ARRPGRREGPDLCRARAASSGRDGGRSHVPPRLAPRYRHRVRGTGTASAPDAAERTEGQERTGQSPRPCRGLVSRAVLEMDGEETNDVRVPTIDTVSRPGVE